MRKRKSWAERLAEAKNLPEIKAIPEKMTKRLGPGSMVVPAPAEVDAVIKAVGKHKLVTARDQRQHRPQAQYDGLLHRDDRDLRLDRRPCSA